MNLTDVSGGDADRYDQYFTRPDVARKCMDYLSSIMHVPFLTFDVILEPSCGKGAFLDYMADFNGDFCKRLEWMDIDSVDAAVRKDFLEEPIDRYKGKLTLVYGNPPYGKNSSKAVAFFNHAAAFAAVIAFIVPRTFQKHSLQSRLAPELHLVGELPIGDEAFEYENKAVSVPSVFQVWVRYDRAFLVGSRATIAQPRTIDRRLPTCDDFAFVTADKADIAIRRVGVNAGRIFLTDVETRSVNSHYFVRLERARYDATLKKLMDMKLDESAAKEMTAGCPSLSKKEIVDMYNEKYCGINV